MSQSNYDMNDMKRRMQSTVNVFKTELSGLRTGRASTHLLEPITVEVYGQSMPINQVATVSVPESRLIAVQVWDKSNVGAVERAIRESSLGLNPIIEGTLLRLPIPELNRERRTELTKIAHKYAEQAKVAVRHVRRDGMEEVKKLEKDGKLTQDDSHVVSDRIQKLTDETIIEIDKVLAVKQHEIMQV